jgi:hypothetical protein
VNLSNRTKTGVVPALFCAVFALSMLVTPAASAGQGHGMMSHTTTQFVGAKANTGTATHTVENGQHVLTLSDDFVVPDTPAPHWQVVDSRGNVFLLQLLVIKGDKYNKRIVLPPYIRDVAKVQIWCAWAETLLGEASFEKPIKIS